MPQVPIRVVRFWTDYEIRNGKTVAIDKVEYCAPGMAQRATTVARVADLKRIRTDVDPENKAFQMAVDRWETIGPMYDAWKLGHQEPERGTPLGAWPGINAQQAEVMRNNGIRSVEEIAEASDSTMTRIPLPGLREMQINARRFLSSKDQSAVAESISRLERENADLRDQLQELVSLLKEEASELSVADPPKRRGRPPKVRDVAPAPVASDTLEAV